ncbi:MAG: transporter [Halobacteriales archaeon]
MADTTTRPDAITAAETGLIGLVTFVVGYVLTYAWRAPAVSDSLSGLNFLAQLLGVDAIPTWKGVGWLFYGAHGVGTRFPMPGGGTELVNLVEQSGEGPVALLYLLVPLLLVLAGAVGAWRAGAEDGSSGAVAGAMVAIGYFMPAAIGTVLFAHGIENTGRSIAVDPITGVLLAGVIYPVVFGAIGGILASFREPQP